MRLSPLPARRFRELSTARTRLLATAAALLTAAAALSPAPAHAAAFLVTAGENDRAPPATIQALNPASGAASTFATTPSAEVGPKAIALGPTGDLFVLNETSTSNSNYSVLRYNGATGAFVSTFVPAGPSGPQDAKALTFGPDGNLYVASGDASFGGSGTASILKYNGTTGAFIGTFASGGSLVEPMSLIFSPSGILYVGDGSGSGDDPVTDTIHRYAPNGTPLADLGSERNLTDPNGLAFGPDGALYVSNENFSSTPGGGALSNSVLRYDPITGTDTVFVASGSGGLSEPFGLTFGPDGNLYVVSGDNGSVYRYNGTSGAFIDQFASELSDPKGIVYDPAAGGQPVPEPGTLAIIASGLLGLGLTARRRSKAE